MEYKKYILITFFFRFVRSNLEYCDDLSPYPSEVNLDEIAGSWNGVEIIPHLENSYEMGNTDECFKINIRERYLQPLQPNSSVFQTPEPIRIRHFVLEWLENEQQVDFYIKVNPSVRAFWPMEPPNGYVTNMDKLFGGIIQVLEMSSDHLVLNFCIRMPYSQLYTVVLARNGNQLADEDLVIIHNIISTKHISVSNTKRVCVNSALVLTAPSVILLVLCFMSLMKYHNIV